MAKDSPLNIFHASAKSKKPTQTGGATKFPAVSSRNIAIEAMLERMDEMRKDIDLKLENLMKPNGLTKERLQEYLNNPQNFTNEQWQFLQEKNQELSKKIWTTVETVEPIVSIAEEAQPKLEPRTSPQSLKTDATSTGPASATPMQGRKGKFVGSRRHWIPTN